MDGIIFDVDGTIWDSTDIAAESFNHVIKEYSDLDIQVTRDDLMALFGKTMEEIHHTIFQNVDSKEVMRLGQVCIDYENKLLETKHGTLYEGMKDVIRTLAREFPLYIVSNCQKGYIEVMLKTMDLEECFVDFLCYGETLKPKSYTISGVMERNQLKDVIYVGDTAGDYTACQEVGIPFIQALYGYGKPVGAKWSVTKPSELIDVINSAILELT